MYFNSWCLTYIKSTKCKYANTNGAENNTPSNLSSIPPCPGRILPESFTPVLLFICDSVKSPNVPNTTIKNEQVIQCKIELSVKNANKNPVANATTANDAVIPPGYGDTIVKRGKDTIALNNDDTVVAGTNLGGGSNKTGERTNQLLESLIMQNAKKPELSPVGLYEVQ